MNIVHNRGDNHLNYKKGHIEAEAKWILLYWGGIFGKKMNFLEIIGFFWNFRTILEFLETKKKFLETIGIFETED